MRSWVVLLSTEYIAQMCEKLAFCCLIIVRAKLCADESNIFMTRDHAGKDIYYSTEVGSRITARVIAFAQTVIAFAQTALGQEAMNC